MHRLNLFQISLSSILLLRCVAFPEANFNADDTKLTEKRCPGGFLEDVLVDLGRYWYKCKAGELQPMGCFNDRQERIDIGQTYDSNQAYRMQCVNDADGLAIVYKSCVYDGQEHAQGETWDDGKYWYTCTKEGDYLRIVVSGCIDEGRRVDANSKTVKGSFVYQCKRSSNGTCSMCPVACEKNGREYQIGDNFEIGDFLYTCTNTDGSGPISIKRIGCMKDKQTLKDGEHFITNDVIYECTVRKDSADIKVIGCAQKDDNGATIERPLDCYWNEGRDQFQYQMTCKKDAEKGAAKVPLNCVYKMSGGAYTIQPECYQIAGKEVISCEKEPNAASIFIRLHQIDDIGQLTAKGLRNC